MEYKEERFLVQVLKIADFEEVMNIMKNAFIPREAMCCGIHADAESLSDQFTEWVGEYISSGLSICAIHEKSGRIASVVLGKILTREKSTAFKRMDVKNSKAILLDKIFQKIEHSFDVFEDESMKKVYECAIMATDSKFVRRGLATMLLKKTFDIAREAGCQATMCQATGLISQLINRKSGYVNMLNISYDSFKIDGKAVFDIAAMHDSTYVAINLKKLTTVNE